MAKKQRKKSTFWEDFKKFIKRGNVVDMAVGVAVATAFTAIVTAFTKGFITPLLALLTGNTATAELKWVIRPEVVNEQTGEVITAEVAILWGGFIQAIIDFLIVAFVLFLILRIVSQIGSRVKKLLENEEKLAAEKAAKEKADAEAAAKKAEEDRIAKEAAEKEAEECAREMARLLHEEELLVEIRDLLREIKKG